jgi:hypothetical protein
LGNNDRQRPRGVIFQVRKVGLLGCRGHGANELLNGLNSIATPGPKT